MSTIQELPAHPKTKYYTIRSINVDKNHVAIYSSSEYTGKHNAHLKFSLFVAVPLLDKAATPDTINNSYTLIKGHKVLMLINGKPVKNFKLESLKKSEIRGVDMMADSITRDVYGYNAQNGVMLISTYKTASELGILEGAPSAEAKIRAWLGIKFSHEISSRLSGSEKRLEYKKFVVNSNREFKSKNLADFQYLDRIGNTDNRNGYIKGIKGSRLPVEGNEPIIFEAVNEPYAARNGNKATWLLDTLAGGTLLWMILIAVPGLKPSTRARKRRPIPLKKRFYKEVGFMIPKPGFYVTPILINFNLAVFIIMVIAGFGFVSLDINRLLDWGANNRPYVLEGQWWRLLTSMFLHGGVMHLVMNMFSLMLIGIFLEHVIGTRRYIAAYFLTGIIAGLNSLIWHTNGIGVGASGAIFGMYGVFGALLTTGLFPNEIRKSLGKTIVIFIGYNLLFGLVGGVDNAAHLGGLISGMLVGYAFYPSLKRQSAKMENENVASVVEDVS